ncbi:MAG: integral rane sensor signal transduction histidine kinase [Pedosphaera sp.]|nr:integral rane sensor signal transduction histidine kinase [Pedosphaera sp.]
MSLVSLVSLSFFRRKTSTRIENSPSQPHPAPCILPPVQDHASQNAGPLPGARRKSEITRGPFGAALPDRTVDSQPHPLLANSPRQYVLALAIFVVVTLINNIWLEQLLGYQPLALVYLFAIVVLALFINRGPLLFGTALTALGWAFTAPPRHKFYIDSLDDKMMFATYFVVALTIGQLTTRLRAQREAEIKSKFLAESERLGRTLLNSVSHELRTPIAAITGAASEMLNSGSLTPLQQKLATEIESAGLRLNRVVQSLLSAARIQSGQLHSKLDWCDISELVHLATHEVPSLNVTHRLTVDIAPGLPFVKLDFILTQQALANLLVNATTHTPPGTPIHIVARIQNKHLLLKVADHGPGLPPDQLDRIFDLFHRAPAAKPGGTGLGLAIVKGFVEAQGGWVQASNRVGGGALFTMGLPAIAAPALPAEPS